MGQIVGRTVEVGRVDRLVRSTAEPALVVVGDPGLGKSTLLDHAARTARASGTRLLTTRGVVGERRLPLAALHRLLLPLLDDLSALPGPQRRAVAGAFGQDDAAAVPDRLHLAAGVLSLVVGDDAGAPDDAGEAGEAPRTLVVVDDLQWVDEASRDVLLFCARRLAPGDPTTMLLASRPATAPEDLPALTLGPLAPADAERLLDELDSPPPPHRRPDLVAQADGNPLALVELARHGDASRLSSDHAPRTLVEHAYGNRSRLLPVATRSMLVLAAAGEGDALAVVLAAARLLGLDGVSASDDELMSRWAPAEIEGIVHLDGSAVRFRHPLARKAVYDTATRSERAAAHHALADASPDLDRRAWHLAAAALGPDPAVAQALEETADRARARGGWAAAAHALERAGELSTQPAEAARRFLLAAPAAMYAGRTTWVKELARRARRAGGGPATDLEADFFAAWAVAGTARHADAVERLLAVARQAARVAPGLAEPALPPATVAAYHSGDDRLLDAVATTLTTIGLDDDDPTAVWVGGATRPFSATVRDALDRAVRRIDEPRHIELNVLGGAAWVLEETTLAERLLGRLQDLFAEVPTQGSNALVTGTLAAARFELGRWDDAQAGADDAVRLAEHTGMTAVRAAAVATLALVAAGRGRTAEARDLAHQALAAVDPEVTRSVGLRARHALGLAALVDGDPETTYTLVRRAFDENGRPVHRHASVHSLVLLAQTAVRVDRGADARVVVEAVARHVGPDPGCRVTVVLHHARALLAGSDDADAHFRAALADPAGATWPFERALVRLDLGERLRRDRRVSEARTELSAALETFVRIGARPYVERATGELRAAGVQVAARAADPLGELTAQQRRIVRLAAQGRTNKEIAERLYLSPRTVGFHLYRVFPLLGVTSRAQLRDVVGPV